MIVDREHLRSESKDDSKAVLHDLHLLESRLALTKNDLRLEGSAHLVYRGKVVRHVLSLAFPWSQVSNSAIAMLMAFAGERLVLLQALM